MENSRMLNVLMVDDNAADVLYFKTLMARSSDHQFMITDTSQLRCAKKLLANGGYDLVLLDLSLTDSSAQDTVKDIPNILETSHDTPIVVLTSSADRNLSIKAVLNGACDYVTKDQCDAKLITGIVQHAIDFSRRMAAA